MSDLMMEFSDAVCDAQGTFRAWAMAREGRDGRWQGWLEFVPADRDTSIVYATPIEMRGDDRALMAQWAAGVTYADATRTLSRATIQQATQHASELLLSLEEVVEALDRRIPQSERVGEA